jgi:signal transduction histidine kinase
MRRLIGSIRQAIANRLQWKLTFSYMVVIVLTLLVMQCCLMSGIAYLMYDSDTPSPSQAGEFARAIALLLQTDLTAPQPDVSAIEAKLHRFLSEQGETPTQQEGPVLSKVEGTTFEIRLQPSRNTVVVIDPQRQVLVTSDPTTYPRGSYFANGELSQWTSLIEQALSGETDIRTVGKLTAINTETQTSIAAYPIRAADREVTGVVCVYISPPSGGRLMGVAFFFVVTTIFVLLASLLSAVIAGIFGYRSARALTRPIQQLSQASQALAAGDFTQQIEVDTTDEIGQLAARFDDMAARLGRTMADLDAEKQYAENLLTAKQELVANVSHELRTPLASIRGHVESLLTRKEQLRADEQEYLEIIQDEIDTLSSLIDDLFELSRLEARELELTLAALPVAEVINKTVRGLQKLAWEQHKVSLNAQVPNDLPLVLADGQRLGQILTNLIHNALRFTPEGGVVMITAQASSDCVEVSVRDTGVGIPPEDLPHIFERFYRADKSRSRAHGGSGLGLAIVKQLVEMQGGTISVESIPGEGSQFRFALPTT